MRGPVQHCDKAVEKKNKVEEKLNFKGRCMHETEKCLLVAYISCTCIFYHVTNMG